MSQQADETTKLSLLPSTVGSDRMRRTVYVTNRITILFCHACRLFEGLTDPQRQRAVINVDDVYADRIKAVTDVPFVTFAVNDRSADVTIESMGITTLQETDITIVTPIGSFQVCTVPHSSLALPHATSLYLAPASYVHCACMSLISKVANDSCLQVITPLIGLQNIYNLLAATAVGVAINIPLEVNTFPFHLLSASLACL